MENKPTVRSVAQLLLGLSIVAVGVIFTLHNLGFREAVEYLRYWPALIVAFGAVSMYRARSAAGIAGALLIVIVGVLLFLDNLGAIHFRVDDLWPLLIIALGVFILWRALAGGPAPDRTSTISGLAVMSGFQRTSNTEDFQGGHLTAIMGGCEVDLRQADMQVDEAVIDVFALWGGIEVRVPESWTVSCEVLPLLGGFEESTRAPIVGPRKVLRIRGIVVMGGVEVRN